VTSLGAVVCRWVLDAVITREAGSSELLPHLIG
jgi:hypothetical protein